jgi:penicillin-binding protein 2
MADNSSGRKTYIRLLFGLAALVLWGQAMRLQLLDPSYGKRAEATTIEQITLYPARGNVLDRHGNLLVYNQRMYDLLAVYNRIDPEMDTARFCRFLGISRQTFEENLKKDWTEPRFSKSVPFVFLSKIPDSIYTRFSEVQYQFPGFYAQLRHVRGYPHPHGAHVLGAIREVNQQEIDSFPEYSLGDYIGDGGLEQAYEEHLRGRKGVRFVLKDNLGRETGEFKERKKQHPELGSRLQTSLSLELQAYAESLMQNKIGSIVAIEPATGEVLAMASAPDYDPNELAISRNRAEAYRRLQSDPGKFFFDRSVMAQYPPGSLFKPLLALIGLQLEAFSPEMGVSCSQGYVYNGQLLTGCHAHPYCGNVVTAIQHSCNAYFVTVFRRIVDRHGFRNPAQGLDELYTYLDKFGLNRRLSRDFPSEESGYVPSSSFFDRWYKDERWNSIWIRSLGIGQGELLMTNLQMANAAAMIANRGYYYRPHLVTQLNQSKWFNKEPVEVGIDSVHFEFVIEGMERAVWGGTARMAFVPDIRVCGKTGTAENPHGKDHSIFFGFAPRENPKIAVAVYVENAGFGGTFAAPIASLVMEKWIRLSWKDLDVVPPEQHLDGDIHPSRKWIEKRMREANLLDLP